MRIVRVELGEHAYSIYIGPDAVALLQKCNAPDAVSTQVVIVADETVAQLHLERLQAHLPPNALVLTFPPGEASKSIRSVQTLYDRLAAARIERNALIVTLGGGVASDLGGFVAATWLRGVRFLAVPTTLLAAIDASVGGKTGVNLSAGKNLVGAFHQPEAVVVDTNFLQTLPAREHRSGLTESVKHAAVRDQAFAEWQELHAAAIVAREPDVTAELIARNCAIKAEVVARDEREAGLRAILNYGHTIGHAIEHLLGYELRHGECVALGMLAENELACARGLLPRGAADRVHHLLERFDLPQRLPRAVDAAQVVEACRLDKKVRDSAINFVLLRDLGQPLRVADVSDAEIITAMSAIQSP